MTEENKFIVANLMLVGSLIMFFHALWSIR